MKLHARPLLNLVLGIKARKSPRINWGIRHGCYAYEAEDAYSNAKKLKLYDQYREGKISKNTYMQASEKISAKQMELADQLAEIDKKTYEANRNLAASVDVKTTLTEVRKLDSFDTAVLKKIIKYVKVYEDHIEYEWADFVK